MINVKKQLLTRLGKPNANGCIYEEKSFKKALKKYIKTGGQIYNKMYDDPSKKHEDEIGRIKNYKIKKDEVLCECIINEDLFDKLGVNLVGISINDYDKLIDIEYIDSVFTDDVLDETTKEYYTKL